MNTSLFKGIFCIFVMSFIRKSVEAVPTTRVPWAYPCTAGSELILDLQIPTNQMISNNNTDKNMAALKEKLNETIQLGKSIMQHLVDAIKDKDVEEMIKTKSLFGFPQVVLETENLQTNSTATFRIIYNQLSQAAVFLFDIVHMQKGTELINQLQDLMLGNLSQMCELSDILYKNGETQPSPANRSIMGQLPKTMTNFQKTERCLNVLYKYVKLIKSHLRCLQNIDITS